MFHGYYSPVVLDGGNGNWHEMVMIMKNYAEDNRYILAAS